MAWFTKPKKATPAGPPRTCSVCGTQAGAVQLQNMPLNAMVPHPSRAPEWVCQACLERFQRESSDN